MVMKESVKREISDLKSFKKIYETIAFLTFTILILQQLVYLVVNLINFTKLGWFTTANFASANLQAFISRIVTINSTSIIIVILAILGWLLYYFLLYILVWRFSQKRNMAKWTWTLFVSFGPTLFFIPAYIWFILYVFRKPIMIVIKKIIDEFKKSNVIEEDTVATSESDNKSISSTN
ncbi:MAG: hypothetical protein WC152_03630 [Candidatus Izemoplasmatales bacterium]